MKVEDKFICGDTKQVRYVTRSDLYMPLPVPLDLATNKKQVEQNIKDKKYVEKLKTFKLQYCFLTFGIYCIAIPQPGNACGPHSASCWKWLKPKGRSTKDFWVDISVILHLVPPSTVLFLWGKLEKWNQFTELRLVKIDGNK